MINPQQPGDATDLNWFHWKDGWYFASDADGDVYMRHDKSDTLEVIPSNEWASIVAHVSYQGENADSYSEVLAFHLGEG